MATIIMAFVANRLEAQITTPQSQTTVPAPTAYTVVSQDANSRIWQREEYEADPNGQIITHYQHYTELATGLNFKDYSGNFHASKEEIDIQPDGTAAATQGQHKVYFPMDILNGQIQMVGPDGLVLKSQPAMLSYDDGTNTAIIAVLTNSVGQLIGSNQVIYTNAFSGLDADLLYSYTRSGFEQDVIIRRQPPTPAILGLNSDSARMQVMTEFFSPPQPALVNGILPNQAGLALNDQTLDFGMMRMGSGRGFLLGQSAAEPGALVAKSWETLDGRRFLVEEVPVNAIVEGLAALPLTAKNGGAGKPSHLASRRLVPPKHRFEGKSISKMAFTKGRLPTTGFVLDYQTINSSLTNYTFQCDSTYFISGAVNLYESSTFEGGSVLKFATNGSITMSGSAQSINWQGGAYRPVIFTSKDDNSVGEGFGSGTPVGYYGNPMLSLGSSLPLPTLTSLRFCYAQTAIQDVFVDASIYDAQFVNCQNALVCGGAALFVGNALFANTLTNIIFAPDGNASANIQNSTLSGSAYLATAPTSSQGITLVLTNCIVANVTNILAGTFLSTDGDYNGSYNSASFASLGFVASASQFPFQTVGDGHYYLTSGCAFHSVGTTNIDPELMVELSLTTTYPPVVYHAGTISVPGVLGPQAERDNTGNPDIGYHYDPVDYVFGGSDLYANLTITAGTAVGYYDAHGSVSSSGQPYGISLNSGSAFTSTGTATDPCWVVDFKDVQEGSGSWSDSGWMGAVMLNGNGSGSTPQINSTFTKWGRPSTLFFRDNLDHGEGTFANCEFYAGSCATYDSSFLYFTNCVFDREAFYCFDQDAVPIFTMQNCTFYNGLLVLARGGTRDKPAKTYFSSRG
ncbi:MAG TPA: hypothetical protein VNX46_09950 [Candidatus Acidoferrum sp.]|nr:hypothetical protein [Candidatus Acidoferrum sp.]